MVHRLKLGISGNNIIGINKEKKNMEEVWKDIKGFEGLYQISNFGNVKSLDRTVKIIGKNQFGTFITYKQIKGKILSQSINKYGYCQVVLYKNGKGFNKLVHQLVAIAFIDNVENKPTVNHKDGNKTNNYETNLEWATEKEQQNHSRNIFGHKSIISQKCRDCRKYKTQQKRVERSDGMKFNSIKEAANGNESLRKHISEVCKGKRNYAGGYSWKYI